MSMNRLFTDVLLIDGTGRDPIADACILVSGNRIKKIGKRAEFVESDAKVIDLGGKTVLPGLINTHVHILLEPVGNSFDILLRESVTHSAVRGASNLMKHLNSGVTYLRDMGGHKYIDVELRRCLAEGLLPGPGLSVSGKVLTMTGGQCHSIGRECDGPAEVSKGAREQLKEGVDFIKLMATGGVMTPGSQPGTAQLTLEEMKAAVEVAHQAGKRVAAHVQGRQGAENAILAGVDTIEHGVFLDDQLVDMMCERGVYLVPTLSAPHYIIQYGEKNGIPAFMVEKTKRITDSHQESFRKALVAGVKIAMGTDSGTPFNRHDESPYELSLMVGAGMPSMDAITAATKTASEMLSIDNDYGTLEEGKMADFLIMNRNPLEDMEAIRDIEAVYKGGIEVRNRCQSVRGMKTL